MSRELKFRALNKNGLVSRSVTLKELVDRAAEDGLDFDWWFSSGAVMQFTGLLDKNGKEIYEGDVITFVYGYETVYKEEVRWDDFTVGYLPFSGYDSDCSDFVKKESVEIIGNVWENPELLAKS